MLVSKGEIGSRVQRFVWHHPEWWLWLVSAVAWVMLIGNNVTLLVSSESSVGGHDHHIHSASSSILASVLAGSIHWQLMVVAMTFPMLAPVVRGVAFRSLWRRRHRAIVAFLIGYLSTWTVIGFVVAGLLVIAPGLAGKWQAGLTVAAFALAFVWQFTRTKKRAMIKSHATMPLSPHGMKADRDCLIFGWRIGRTCNLNCWILMTACTLAAHSIIALAVCGYIGYSEKYSWRPNTKLTSLGIVGLIVVFGSPLITR